MIAEYLEAALKQAHYELDDNTFFAEIPGFAGIVAYGDTLEDCRQQLIDVLEGWLLLGIRHGHSLPVLDGINLNAVFETA